MPIQLKILAIFLAVAFFAFIINLIYRDRAEVRHMRKWILFAIIILIGAMFPELTAKIAYFLGFKTLMSFTLFSLTGLLFLIVIRLQISVIGAESRLKLLTQELSILKKRVKELEDDKLISNHHSSCL